MKPKLPTGPPTAEEIARAEGAVWKSGSVADVKAKGVRKAALVPLAESWSESLRQYQESIESRKISEGAAAADDYHYDDDDDDDYDDDDDDWEDKFEEDEDDEDDEGSTSIAGSDPDVVSSSFQSEAYKTMPRDRLLQKLFDLVCYFACMRCVLVSLMHFINVSDLGSTRYMAHLSGPPEGREGRLAFWGKPRSKHYGMISSRRNYLRGSDVYPQELEERQEER